MEDCSRHRAASISRHAHPQFFLSLGLTGTRNSDGDVFLAARLDHHGRRAVLTPLARDRARAAGVEIVKER